MTLPFLDLQPEIDRVLGLCAEMTDRYVEWGGRIKHGEVHFTVYGDLIDFSNFRVETANSCLDLVREGRVADALGLCRSLLENYLLLMLMCRGTRFFRLRNLEDKDAGEFAEILAAERHDWEQLRASGETPCLDVRKYPRAKRHIMYVYEGLKADNDDVEVVVPVHFFEFREFRPETLRLKPENYFEYYPPPDELKKALKGHRAQAEFRYRHFLSYDALLECLRLNEIIDDQVELRVEAHYTFLGRFLHPTHDAARSLHLGSNVYDGKPAVGMNRPYSPAAKLLALVYTAFLLAGVLEETAMFVENAPARYIAAPGTDLLRTATARVRDTIRYFWFLFNEASPYDKFNWAVHHATDEQLAEHGGYAYLPTSLVAFNRDVYGNFQQALGGCSNVRVGFYVPPIGGAA